MTTILFVCGKNRRLSPTAKKIFAGMDGIEVSSAGTSVEAECPVSAYLLEWADRVFVMQPRQQRYLRTHFASVLKDKKIICLNVPDIYSRMQPELVEVLRATVLPRLRR